MQNTKQNQQYCRELVRSNDRERYYATLFAPASAQRMLWAVLAFNQEVANIRNSVSEVALGEIRLQWWQEVLEELQSGTVREQPVIGELAMLEARPDIWPLLREALAARSLEMFSDGPADLSALENYADGVGGATHEAFLRICIGDDVSGEAVMAARAGGAAWSMLGLIRALPFHWQAGRSILPKENDSALQFRDAAEAFEVLAPAILKMKGYVEAQYRIATVHGKAVHKKARASILQTRLIRLHLNILEQVGNNPFETPPYEAGDLRKILTLFWGSITGRI